MKDLTFAAIALGAVLLSGPALADAKTDATLACDTLTSSPFDPDRRTEPPLSLAQIDVPAAIEACSLALTLSPEDGRLHFQLGRAYEASEQFDLAWDAYSRGSDLGLPVSIRAVARMAYLGLGRAVDIDAALELYRRAADLGLVTAQWEYGIALISDLVEDKDYDLAFKYFMLGAEGGAFEAMREVGVAYEKGRGVTRDYDKAEMWYLKAAEAGHALTMNDLAIFYGYAEGREPEYDKARLWFERSMELGNPDAPHNLAMLYEAGRGVAVDDAKAIELYRVAIDRGNLKSLHNLGVRLFETTGPEHDSSEAAFWFYQSLLHEEKFTFDILVEDPDYWDEEFRKAMQQLMTKDGFYNGPINGLFDEATIAALRIALGPRY